VECDAGPREFIGYGVAAVALDAREDEGGFWGGEEGAACDGRGLRGFVGEVDDSQVAEEAEEDGYCAFLCCVRDALVEKRGGIERGKAYDCEYPPPPVQSANAFHLAQTPCKNVTKSTR
jgi:hypothetical protein